MSNKTVVKRIMGYDKDSLFDFVMSNPEYLTDSYYREFGDAIRHRYKQLIDVD